MPDTEDVSPLGCAQGGSLSTTERTTHHRLRDQGRSERAELMAVLGAGFIAHLGVPVVPGVPTVPAVLAVPEVPAVLEAPAVPAAAGGSAVATGPAAHGVMVIPTVYGFDQANVYVHGSVASQSLGAAAEYCLTVTVVDGLVLARSVFEHAINYRSAMIYAVPRVVDDPAEKLAGLRLVSEHLAPGQWDYARRPSRKELAATRLLALSLAEASVKIRTGPPDDADSPDAALGLWAGELPLDCRWLPPVPDPALPAGIMPPAHIISRAGNAAHPR